MRSRCHPFPSRHGGKPRPGVKANEGFCGVPSRPLQIRVSPDRGHNRYSASFSVFRCPFCGTWVPNDRPRHPHFCSFLRVLLAVAFNDPSRLSERAIPLSSPLHHPLKSTFLLVARTQTLARHLRTSLKPPMCTYLLFMGGLLFCLLTTNQKLMTASNSLHNWYHLLNFNKLFTAVDCLSNAKCRHT